jgi:hypothetical protein
MFEPLFAVTLDPAADPALHELLQGVSGFDSVDDESIAEKELDRRSQVGTCSILIVYLQDCL